MQYGVESDSMHISSLDLRFNQPHLSMEFENLAMQFLIHLNQFSYPVGSIRTISYGDSARRDIHG